MAKRKATLSRKESILPIWRIFLYIITGVLTGGTIGIIVTTPGEGDNLIFGIALLGAVMGGLLGVVYTLIMERY